MDRAAVTDPARARFSTHVAWTFVTRIATLASGVATGVIVARLLGPSALGTLAVISVTLAVALQIGSAGLPSAATYFIAQDRRNAAKVWASALVFALVAGTAIALVVLAIARFRPSLLSDVPFDLVAIATISIPFQLVTLLGLNAFLGLDRIVQFNLLDASAQLLTLINAVVAVLVIGAGLRTLVSLNVGAAVLVSIIVIAQVGRAVQRAGDGSPFRPNAALLRRMAGYGIKFHIALVASLLIFRSDLLIVNHYRGATEAGVYSVASQVATMLMLLPSVVGTLLFPRVTSATPDAREDYTMRATRHTAFIMIVVIAAAVPAAFALPVVYGRPFQPATLQLLILLPGVFLIGIESVLVQHFTGSGLPVAIPGFWLLTLALNVVLNLIFVPNYGATAAALSSSISYGVLFLLVLIYFRRKTGNKWSNTLVLRGQELRDLFLMARPGIFLR